MLEQNQKFVNDEKKTKNKDLLYLGSFNSIG